MVKNEYQKLEDYVKNCMSKESAKDYLTMKGEALACYEPVMLDISPWNSYSSSYRDNCDLHGSLHHLADIAKNNKCKYVTNIEVIYDVSSKRFHAYGTGLIEKKKR